MIASIALNPSFTLSSFHKTLAFLPSQPAVLPTSKAFSSKPNQNHGHYLHRGKGHGRKLDEHHQDQGQGRDGDEENDERHVHCEVDVVSWRERRVRARVLIHADVETVWSVLTDYERLADFIPNLVYSWRIPCPHKGRIWLEQRGMQGALYWHIEARVVLDLQELPNLADGRELHFTMVDGDFKKFEGKWSVKAGPRSSTATLAYEVNVIPRFNFPAIFLERIIRSDLPVNLQALAWRAEQSSEGTLNYKPINGNAVVATSKDPLSSASLDLSGAVSDIDVHSTKKIKENYACGPMTSSPSIEFNSKWGIYGKVCRLHRPCMVDEVHLRKYDGLLENGGTHRCVIASITVKAPVREVWDVLTAYEALPEIVPNLAISKILSRDNNKVRILQEGCKGLLYMVFHARVVLDLHEKLEQEISFEQVEGDFDSFQGKWLLEQLGNQHTLLKYVVESKMRKDTFLSEAIVEEVIYEDLPSNLCAIRDFVEKREAATNDPQAVTNDPQAVTNDPQEYSDNIYVQADKNVHVAQSTPTKQVSNSDASAKLGQRPKVPGLQRDIEVLKAELLTFILKYGQEGFMPMRKQLRLHGRVDIEKAVSRMGGFRKIANMMNLSLAYKHRKPKGYWDNLENLQEEIIRFQRNWGMDPAYMPSRKSFERAGRYDIARALEKWGGIQEVARLLSLELRHPRRRLNSDRESQHDGKSLDDPNDQEKMSSKPYVSQDTQRWLTKLKELDINWVE